MHSKNFIVIIPDSNGDRQILPITISGERREQLDEHAITAICDQGIENYLNAENPAEREDHIIDALKRAGLTATLIVENFTTITTRE